jgi:hypothetical protein
MAQRGDLARPVMRRGTRLHTHKTPWLLLEEGLNLTAPQLTAHDHATRCINAMYLES